MSLQSDRHIFLCLAFLVVGSLSFDAYAQVKQPNSSLGVFGGAGESRLGEHPDEIDAGVPQPTLNMPGRGAFSGSQITRSTVGRSELTTLDPQAVKEKSSKSDDSQVHPNSL